MRYESKPTSKGNVGVSQESQDLADRQAARMDDYGCTDCTDCTNCHNCANSHNCHNCANSHNCHNCTDCTDCRYCHNCANSHGCHGCTDCHNCHGCTDCTDCVGILRWGGHAARFLLGINGLAWPITISETHIQIGCQYHSKQEWFGFDDQTIAEMAESALDFWRKYKPLIMEASK